MEDYKPTINAKTIDEFKKIEDKEKIYNKPND